MTGRSPRWEFHAVPDPVAGLKAGYQGIYFDLLGRDDPRLNHRLEIRGEDPETRDGWHRALLVTPWQGFFAYIPADPEDPTGLPAADELEADEEGRVAPGSELGLDFGGRTREVEVAYDPRVGHHLVELLLRDTGAFADTEEALAWARTVAASREGREDPAPAGETGPRQVSRRDLLRGRVGGRK